MDRDDIFTPKEKNDKEKKVDGLYMSIFKKLGIKYAAPS